MATSMMSYEHARRERLKESGMSEATATAIADALTSLRNEIAAEITARIEMVSHQVQLGSGTDDGRVRGPGHHHRGHQRRFRTGYSQYLYDPCAASNGCRGDSAGALG